MRLQGKTALVTGSTSGIGLGIAKALAAEGANIIINGFGEEAAIEAERAALQGGPKGGDQSEEPEKRLPHRPRHEPAGKGR